MSTASAEQHLYPVLQNRVVDGDSIEVSINLGFDLILVGKDIRVNGVNAPEVRGGEREAGLIVKSKVEAWIAAAVADDRVLLCRYYGEGKFAGRFIGDLVDDQGNRLSQYLLSNNLALSYDGEGAVPRFSEEALKNIIDEHSISE